MFWRGRGWMIAVAVVVLLIAGALLAVRLALDPDRLRRLAESRLSAAFGRQVRIGRMTTSLVPTPAVEGRDITVSGGDGVATPQLGLRAVRIVPRLSSIFSTPVVVDRVEIDGLRVEVRRRESGWLLPIPPGAAAAGPSGERRFEVERMVLHDGRLIVVDERPGRERVPGTIDRIEAAAHREGQITRLDSISASIGHSSLSGSGRVAADGALFLSLGWYSLGPADLATVFALSGSAAPRGFAAEGDRPLALDVKVAPDGTMTAIGRVMASKVTLDRLTVTGVDSPLRLAGGVLTLEPFQLQAYGGHGRGQLTVRVGSSPVTWALQAGAEGLDVNRFLSATTSARDKLSGTATLEARLGGSTAEAFERTLAGTAALSVSNGVVRDFPLLAALNRVLRIDERDDGDFHFETLSATLQVAGARATTDDLVVQTPTLTVAGAGSLGFDGALAFSGVARFTREKSQELIRRVKELSAQRNAEGEIEVPFGVGGTVWQPTFSVDAGRMLRRAAGKELKRQIEKKLKEIIKIR